MGARLAALWRRGQMAVRGTQWTERPASAVPPADLASVDVLWAAALGELASDPPPPPTSRRSTSSWPFRQVSRAASPAPSSSRPASPPTSDPLGRTRMEVALAEARRLATASRTARLLSHAELVETAAATLQRRLEARPRPRRGAPLRNHGDDDRALPWARQVVPPAGAPGPPAPRPPDRPAGPPPAPARPGDRPRRPLRPRLAARPRSVAPQLAATTSRPPADTLTAAEAAWPYPPAHGYHEQHLPARRGPRPPSCCTPASPPAPGRPLRTTAPLARTTLPGRPPASRSHVDLARPRPRRRLAPTTRRRRLAPPHRHPRRRRPPDRPRGLADLRRAVLTRQPPPRVAEALPPPGRRHSAARGRAIHHAVVLLRLRDPAGTAPARPRRRRPGPLRRPARPLTRPPGHLPDRDARQVRRRRAPAPRPSRRVSLPGDGRRLRPPRRLARRRLASWQPAVRPPLREHPPLPPQQGRRRHRRGHAAHPARLRRDPRPLPRRLELPHLPVRRRPARAARPLPPPPQDRQPRRPRVAQLLRPRPLAERRGRPRTWNRRSCTRPCAASRRPPDRPRAALLGEHVGHRGRHRPRDPRRHRQEPPAPRQGDAARHHGRPGPQQAHAREHPRRPRGLGQGAR
jgi:hypothetical protein